MTAILRLLMVVIVAVGASVVPNESQVALAPPNVSNGPMAYIRVTGSASWYCSSASACTRGYQPSDLVAAIDTSTGFHQGDVLLVRSGNRSVQVVIVDTCLCRGRRVIDLTSGAFRRLAPLSVGVIPVRVELVGGIGEPEQRPLPTGPATDVLP